MVFHSLYLRSSDSREEQTDRGSCHPAVATFARTWATEGELQSREQPSDRGRAASHAAWLLPAFWRRQLRGGVDVFTAVVSPSEP